MTCGRGEGHEGDGRAMLLPFALDYHVQNVYTHIRNAQTRANTHTRAVYVFVRNVRKRESVIMTVYLSGNMHKLYSTYTKQTF